MLFIFHSMGVFLFVCFFFLHSSNLKYSEHDDLKSVLRNHKIFKHEKCLILRKEDTSQGIADFNKHFLLLAVLFNNPC